MDKIEGHLEVGTNDCGDVVVNMPPNKKKREQHKTNCAYRGNTEELCNCGIEYEHIVFSPDQARKFGLMMLRKAGEADGFPGTGEEGEFFIDFNTQIDPGKLQAVRVRLDLVTISDMERQMDISLCDHPLYRELYRYTKANRR